MSENKLPDTSIAAYKAVTTEMLQGHYKKIIDALSRLGTANYETIGDYVGLERHAVGRRLKEMEGLELITKPGTKSPTKSGRMAYNYCLCTSGIKTDNEAKEFNGYKRGEKTSSDFSKELIHATQKTLFP